MNSIEFGRLSIVLLAVGCFFSHPYTALTQAQDYSALVAAIVEQGWPGQADALDRAGMHHDAAVRIDPADSRADYALALVQMRHSQWEAASEALGAAVRKNRGDLYAWRARVWLLIYQRQYDGALAEMDALAAAFSGAPADDASIQTRQRAAAKIMGRVFGYLNGPRKGVIDDAVLARRQASLAAQLGEENLPAFEQGQKEIAADWQRLLDEIEAERATTLAANEQAKDEQRQFVDDETARIESEQAQLQQLAADARELLDEETSRLDSELAPIRLSYADVQARARPFQFRIRELQSRLSAALAEASIGDGENERDRERNRERRRRAQQEADRLRFELRREEEFLRPLILEGQRLEAAAAVIEQRRRAAVSQYQRTVGQLDAQNRQLQRTAKLLRAKERELDRTTSGGSGKIVSMRARLPLWVTYETFPLEAERQRLLNAAKP